MRGILPHFAQSEGSVFFCQMDNHWEFVVVFLRMSYEWPPCLVEIEPFSRGSQIPLLGGFENHHIAGQFPVAEASRWNMCKRSTLWVPGVFICLGSTFTYAWLVNLLRVPLRGTRFAEIIMRTIHFEPRTCCKRKPSYCFIPLQFTPLLCMHHLQCKPPVGFLCAYTVIHQ